MHGFFLPLEIANDSFAWFHQENHRRTEYCNMSQKMKSIFVVILVATVPVAVVFISVFIGWLLEQNHGVERKYEIETVSATELMSHYMRDAYSADQKYTDLAKAHFYGFIVTGKN